MAGANSPPHGSLPWRAWIRSQPRTMPGTEAASGPCATMPSLKNAAVAPAGAGPEALSPSVLPVAAS